MLISFKSPAGRDVTMFEKNAREMLVVLGKPPDEAKGVITVDQLASAIAALSVAIAADRTKPHEPEKAELEANDKPEVEVSLLQRALPLLDLLERSLKDKEVVTWGI